MSSKRLKVIFISVSLAIAVLVVFWRVGGYDFINYDDGSYVFENTYVLKGWSLEGLKWAFTTSFHLHWHPLTWLSLMTDNQFFGVEPGAYHLVNVLIHVLNTILVFYLLNKMTGAVYCSAFVAALFGLHPLHVEPVAWIADRKDVLSAFFWMTTLWMYLRYARKPGLGNAVLVFASFLCSLMAKSMSVTLPLILLVLDYWPLNRLAIQKTEGMPASPQPQAKPALKARKGEGRKNQSVCTPAPEAGVNRTAHSIGRLLFEKALLFLPMIIGAGITLMVIQRKKAPSIELSRVFPTLNTLEGSIVAYAKYLYQMVWPAGLAIPYPRVREFPAWEIVLSLCVLLAISFFAYRRRRRNPYLLAGWLWYLITLLPAIGLVQSGPHMQADRYTYVPLIGIFVMIAWGAADLLAASHNRRWILSGGAAACILACMTVSLAQVERWENSVTIFSHSVRVTENNTVAHNNLGMKLLESGNADEAMFHFKEAIRITPKESYAYLNLGNVYKYKKDMGKAVYYYERALSINPKYANASYNLANVYLQLNKLDLSEKYFLKTIENDKKSYMAHLNLGAAYSRMGKSAEAIAHFQESIKIQPGQHLPYYGLGLEYLKLDNLDKAELNFNKVLEFKPDYERAYCDLGTVMMRRKNYDAAIRHLSKALEINPGYEKAAQLLEQAQKKKMSEAR